MRPLEPVGRQNVSWTIERQQGQTRRRKLSEVGEKKNRRRERTDALEFSSDNPDQAHDPPSPVPEYTAEDRSVQFRLDSRRETSDGKFALFRGENHRGIGAWSVREEDVAIGGNLR